MSVRAHHNKFHPGFTDLHKMPILTVPATKRDVQRNTELRRIARMLKTEAY